jgi:Flp pilus assembly protein TadD
VAHFDLGYALDNQGKREEAVAEYRIALGLRPDYPEALFNRGNAGTVTVAGYDGAGNAVGSLSIDMAAGQAVRINSIMAQLGAPDQQVGRITVTGTPGMQLFAETAEVDAATGDVEYAIPRLSS